MTTFEICSQNRWTQMQFANTMFRKFPIKQTTTVSLTPRLKKWSEATYCHGMTSQISNSMLHY